MAGDHGQWTGDRGQGRVQGVGYRVRKANEITANGALGRGVSVKYNKF